MQKNRFFQNSKVYLNGTYKNVFNLSLLMLHASFYSILTINY